MLGVLVSARLGCRVPSRETPTAQCWTAAERLPFCSGCCSARGCARWRLHGSGLTVGSSDTVRCTANHAVGIGWLHCTASQPARPSAKRSMKRSFSLAGCFTCGGGGLLNSAVPDREGWHSRCCPACCPAAAWAIYLSSKPGVILHSFCNLLRVGRPRKGVLQCCCCCWPGRKPVAPVSVL